MKSNIDILLSPPEIIDSYMIAPTLYPLYIEVCMYVANLVISILYSMPLYVCMYNTTDDDPLTINLVNKRSRSPSKGSEEWYQSTLLLDSERKSIYF